jgi:leucyl/phenylalanyl-tRNA--protein transferase
MRQSPVAWLHDDAVPLPPTSAALGPHTSAPGLLAVGGRLTPQRLREAYGKGVFPWFSDGQPVLWWAPDPRMVLPVAEFRLSRSLKKTLRRFIADPRCAVRIDTAFDAVITACARVPRDGQDGTWIVPEMISAYTDWHAHGAVHSIECWADGELAGGLYGVCLGRMFFGESMFARRTDASKIALCALVAFCRAHGIDWIDCQQNTTHLASFGAREVPRAEFERHLALTLGAPPVEDWTYHALHWSQLGLTPASSTLAHPDDA